MDHEFDPVVRSITNRADRGPGSLRAALDYEDAFQGRHTLTLDFGRLLSNDEWDLVGRAAWRVPFVCGLATNTIPALVPERPVL